MPVDVLVLTNGSELGEYILKKVWEVAQSIFKEYGVEVYVIPYYVPKNPVTLIINGVEYIVKRKLSRKELMDMILSSISMRESKEGEVLTIGTWFSKEGDFGCAKLAT